MLDYQADSQALVSGCLVPVRYGPNVVPSSATNVEKKGSGSDQI